MGNNKSAEQSPAPAPAPAPKKPLAELPWRRFENSIWTGKAHDDMAAALKDCFVGTKLVKYANVVLLGPISSGKSAFVNSCLSIGSVSVLAPADCGQASKSYTTKLGVYEDRCATIGNVRLFDTMGLEDVENEGFNINDVTLLLEGHIPKDYKFNPRNPITPADQAYIKYPKAPDRTHIVVFCIKASLVMRSDGMPKALLRKVAKLQDRIKELGIPRMLILTHVDEICPSVAADITKIFHSYAVEEAVNKAGELFKIPVSYIHPVENYHKSAQTSKKINVPLLLALRQMLDIANDYFQRTHPGDDEGSWWNWRSWWGCNVL